MESNDQLQQFAMQTQMQLQRFDNMIAGLYNLIEKSIPDPPSFLEEELKKESKSVLEGYEQLIGEYYTDPKGEVVKIIPIHKDWKQSDQEGDVYFFENGDDTVSVTADSSMSAIIALRKILFNRAHPSKDETFSGDSSLEEVDYETAVGDEATSTD